MTPATTKWQTLIAVCGKCDGDSKSLRRAIKDELKSRGERDARVVRTSCLDICPKHAVTVAVSGPGVTRCVVVRSADDAAAVVAMLDP